MWREDDMKVKFDVAYLNLEKVLWLAVYLFKRLLTRIWHSLHCEAVIGASVRGSDVLGVLGGCE